MQPSKPNKFDHDLHARTKGETDFWGQIRRTVNGKPVDESQVLMIVDRIREKLVLRETDILLDIACGNGALASRVFSSLSGYQGLDFSEYLIEVANKYFAKLPQFAFAHSGASEYIDAEKEPHRYTKVLCYGSFSYFLPEHAANVLGKLHQEFTNVTHVFIGNLPDKKLAEQFYGTGRVNMNELIDNESPIGIWRSRNEFIKLAQDHGWKTEISIMPRDYYAAYYRYDILLTR